MITISLTDLERLMNRAPPASYLSWLSSHPAEEVERGVDPKTVCVLNLELREGFEGGAWQEHSHKFFIGTDWCGNYFFISDEADRVLLLSHDPPGIEDSEMSVHDFLQTEGWTKCPILQDEDEDIAVVARTEVIGESVLDPILPAQWRDAVARTSQLHCLGGIPSILTGEMIRHRARDLAWGTFDGVGILAQFGCGRIAVREVNGDPQRARALAQRLARHLGARVVAGSKKPGGAIRLLRKLRPEAR